MHVTRHKPDSSIFQVIYVDSIGRRSFLRAVFIIRRQRHYLIQFVCCEDHTVCLAEICLSSPCVRALREESGHGFLHQGHCQDLRKHPRKECRMRQAMRRSHEEPCREVWMLLGDCNDGQYITSLLLGYGGQESALPSVQSRPRLHLCIHIFVQRYLKQIINGCSSKE